MRFSLGIALTLGIGGCIIADIDEVDDGAPVAAVRADSYAQVSGFGTVLAAYTGSDADGLPFARLVGNAGPGSAQLVFDLWNGDRQGGRGVVFDGCEDVGDCELGAGADLIGIPSWSGGQSGCIMLSSVSAVGDPLEGIIRVQCEGGTTPFIRLAPITGVDFGRSLAPLFLDSPIGVALVGAPADGPGAIYRVIEDDALPRVIPLDDDFPLAAGARFGQRIETFELGRSAFGVDDAVIALVAASGERRVIALAIGTTATGVVAAPIACLDDAPIRAPADPVSEGGSFALADLDGDGSPEAIVSDPAGNTIRVAPLFGLGPRAGCDGVAIPQTRIECSALPAGDVSACLEFGADLSAGDFDDDGDIDLAVGAPGSTVRGLTNAGAVFVLPNEGGALSTAGAQPLFIAESVIDARLGTAITTTSSQLLGDVRDEPVASAPGRNRAYIFYCTGLAGDANGGLNRCLPEGG